MPDEGSRGQDNIIFTASKLFKLTKLNTTQLLSRPFRINNRFFYPFSFFVFIEQKQAEHIIGFFFEIIHFYQAFGKIYWVKRLGDLPIWDLPFAFGFHFYYPPGIAIFPLLPVIPVIIELPAHIILIAFGKNRVQLYRIGFTVMKKDMKFMKIQMKGIFVLPGRKFAAEIFAVHILFGMKTFRKLHGHKEICSFVFIAAVETLTKNNHTKTGYNKNKKVKV